MDSLNIYLSSLLDLLGVTLTGFLWWFLLFFKPLWLGAMCFFWFISLWKLVIKVFIVSRSNAALIFPEFPSNQSVSLLLLLPGELLWMNFIGSLYKQCRLTLIGGRFTRIRRVSGINWICVFSAWFIGLRCGDNWRRGPDIVFLICWARILLTSAYAWRLLGVILVPLGIQMAC